MKKCIVCGDKVEEDCVCQNCATFLEWKYGSNYKNKLKEFKKLLKERNNSQLNATGGKK